MALPTAITPTVQKATVYDARTGLMTQQGGPFSAEEIAKGAGKGGGADGPMSPFESVGPLIGDKGYAGVPGAYFDPMTNQWKSPSGAILGNVMPIGGSGGGGGRGGFGGGDSGGGGSGGGHGRVEYDPAQRDVRIGNPGGKMAPPSPMAEGGKNMGSVSNWAKLQTRVSGWEQMQKDKIADDAAVKAARSAQEAFRKDNPALLPTWAQVPSFGDGGTVPPNTWAEVGDDIGNLAAKPELVRSSAPIEVVPNVGRMEVAQGPPDGWWAAPPPNWGVPNENKDDPLQPFRDATSPEAQSVQRSRFMRTPAGRMWLEKAEMDQKAAQAEAQWQADKFNAEMQEKKRGHDITRQNAIDREAGLSDRLKTTQALIEDRFKRSQEGTDKRQANTFEQANNVRKAKEAKDKELSDRIDKGHEEYMAHQIASGTIKAEDAAAIMKLPHAFRQAELVRREKEAADKAKSEGAKLSPDRISSELGRAFNDIKQFGQFLEDGTTPNPKSNPVALDAAIRRANILQTKMDEHLGISEKASSLDSGKETAPKKAGLNDMIKGVVSP